MNNEQVTATLIVVLTLAVVVTVGLVLWKLELSMIYTLALILVVGVALALVIAAASLPIRAHRSSGTREREIIRERHTIQNGRRDPRIITLNGSGGSGMDRYLFPEVIRGLITSGQRQREAEGEELVDGAVVPDDEWRGPIEG